MSGRVDTCQSGQISLAQQQFSHAKLATTEAHYLQRKTHGPDVRATL